MAVGSMSLTGSSSYDAPSSWQATVSLPLRAIPANRLVAPISWPSSRATASSARMRSSIGSPSSRTLSQPRPRWPGGSTGWALLVPLQPQPGDAFAALILALIWASSAAAHECPSYSGREWEFTGHLVNAVTPGPPNYESLTSGDKPVTRWYLQLPWPACFAEYRHLTRMQLSLMPQEAEKYRQFLGEEIIVNGTLVEGEPSRHTTSLVMNVSSLVRLARRGS